MSYSSQATALIPKICAALSARNLAPPADFLLARSQHCYWLFAIMDTANPELGKLERYTSPHTLHQLETYLGLPVRLSNTSGLRYGILLSPLPNIPTSISFPGFNPTRLLLGYNRFSQILTPWSRFGHWAIGGMTGWGKSNLLSLLAIQALSIGSQVAVLDLENRTFPQFKYSPSKFASAHDEASCSSAIASLYSEYHSRKHLFDSLEPHHFPQDIFAYNRLASALSSPPLPPIFAFIEEYIELKKALPPAAISSLESLSRLSRKYGIHLILSGQDWNKSEVGPILAQCHTRLAVRMSNYHQSQVLLNQSGAEKLETPGRVLSNRFGLFQSYHLPPEKLNEYLKNNFTLGNQIATPLKPVLKPVSMPNTDDAIPLFEPLDLSAIPPEKLYSMDEKIALMLEFGVSKNAIISALKSNLPGSKQDKLRYIDTVKDEKS